MEIIITIAALVALYYNFQSLTAVIIAQVPEAAWKELFKMAVNLAIIFYMYGK
jgi:hypothetical protein